MCHGSSDIWKKVVKATNKIGCEEEFELFWKDVQNKATYLRINPLTLPKKRRAPPKIEECLGINTAPEFDQDIISYYKKIYYEALDCITNAITDRFDYQDFKAYIKLQNLLIKADGDDFHTDYDNILSIYSKDFEDNRFQVQLETLSEYCKELGTISFYKISEV